MGAVRALDPTRDVVSPMIRNAGADGFHHPGALGHPGDQLDQVRVEQLAVLQDHHLPADLVPVAAVARHAAIPDAKQGQWIPQELTG